jgi:hypothetical protein
LQAALDAASIEAVLELDGTQEGLVRARAATLGLGGRTGFVVNDLEFAVSAGGPWEKHPAKATGVRLVRLPGSARVELALIRGFVHEGASQVWAVSQAEQRPVRVFDNGLFPDAPVASSAHGPHYGLGLGRLHTLRRAAAPSIAFGNVCEGGSTQEAAGAPEDSGEAGETGGAQAVRDAILWGSGGGLREIGGSAPSGVGPGPAESAALLERIGQDTDALSRTYAQYAASGAGNGRRIVAAPIRSQDNRILEVGAFFLLPTGWYRGEGDRPVCAEYIGAYLEGSRRRGAAESGFYRAGLVR